jgi:hypothetical protein
MNKRNSCRSKYVNVPKTTLTIRAHVAEEQFLLEEQNCALTILWCAEQELEEEQIQKRMTEFKYNNNNNNNNNSNNSNNNNNNKFWEEPIAYFPSIRHGPHRKPRVQQFYYCICFRCRDNGFTEPLPSNERKVHFTELLPSNDMRNTRTHTQADERYLWSTPLRWAQVPWYT